MIFPKNEREKIASNEMSTFTISCKADGYPEPTYKIYNGTTKLRTHGGVFISNRPATYEDNGKYKCIAMNVLGNVTGIFKLRVKLSEEYRQGLNIFTFPCFIANNIYLQLASFFRF